MRREVAMGIAKWGTAATLFFGGGGSALHSQNEINNIEDIAPKLAATRIVDPELPVPSQDLIRFSREVSAREREIAEIIKEHSSTSFGLNEDGSALQRALAYDTAQRIDAIREEIVEIQESSEYESAIAPQREYQEGLIETAQLRSIEEDKIKNELGHSKWRKINVLSSFPTIGGMFVAVLNIFNDSRNRPSWPLPERRREKENSTTI